MREVLIFFLLAAVLVMVARKTRPALDQQGQVIVEPEQWAEVGDVLKVATFNIQTGKNMHGERDVTRAAAVIADADIVGLQEVAAQTWLNKIGVGSAQISKLAQVGEFGYLFAATRRRWFRQFRGNALLSKLPISSWKTVMLPDQTGKSYRNMTIAEFSYKGVPVVIINTHLHTQEGREQQLKIVLDEFAKYPRAILIGDFNSTQLAPQLESVLAVKSINDAIASAGLATGTPSRIDWILTKGFKVINGRMLEKGISDHPYFEVSLILEN